MRIFPNQDSCLRLVTALAMEMREEWMGRRSLIFKDEGAAKKMEDLLAA
jgi:transposase-like protein